jgi:hypothetical protein
LPLRVKRLVRLLGALGRIKTNVVGFSKAAAKVLGSEGAAESRSTFPLASDLNPRIGLLVEADLRSLARVPVRFRLSFGSTIPISLSSSSAQAEARAAN